MTASSGRSPRATAPMTSPQLIICARASIRTAPADGGLRVTQPRRHSAYRARRSPHGCALVSARDARSGGSGLNRADWLQPSPDRRELQEGLLGLEDAVGRPSADVRRLAVEV